MSRETELVKALEQSVEIIKQWHNMQGVIQHVASKEVEQGWKIYYEHSPEMKPIRAALSSQEGVRELSEKGMLELYEKLVDILYESNGIGSGAEDILDHLKENYILTLKHQ